MDPTDTPVQEVIISAVEVHDVDMDNSVVAQDDDPESDRIYIIECIDGEYRLISYGVDSEGRAANEDPIRIPETAVGAVQGLMHAAGMHVVNQEFVPGPGMEPQISLRDLAQGMGLSKPMEKRDPIEQQEPDSES